MKVLRYPEWQDTALTLHLLTQMMGKVKLMRLTPQPEWHHTVLAVTPEGFCTGLVPCGDNGAKSFSLSLNLRQGQMTLKAADGGSSGFFLRDQTSVSEYYSEFKQMLEQAGCATPILSLPQEMSISAPFEEIIRKCDFNREDALAFHSMCLFAHNAILRFVSPFRGKKILPCLFWGTFDCTGILFGGEDRPFDRGGIIEKAAFDEQMIEFGFWPGDPAVADPSFFILPYPFLDGSLDNVETRPDKAVYSREKKEWFFKLEDVLGYPDPEGALQEFFRMGYAQAVKYEGWKNLEWLGRPLLTDLK